MGRLHRIHVILGLQNRNYPLLEDRAYAVYNGLSGHPQLFLAPNPDLPTLLGRIKAFSSAQQAVRTRTLGAAATRDLRARELVTCLEGERTYVQALCDESPEQGPLLVSSAGMLSWQPMGSPKPLLRARQIMPGAPVELFANVGLLTAETKGKVYFNWGMSSDGGHAWTTLPSTPHGDTEVTGLAALQTYAFRVSVTDRSGPTPWSQVIAFLVH